MNQIVFESATKLAQAIREKRLSTTEVISAHLEQIGPVLSYGEALRPWDFR
jgi:hypothetical protein